MAESILAPCPFCGGKAKALTGFSPINKSYVFCIDCDVSTHTAETLEEVVAVWNRRALVAEAESLQQKVLDLESSEKALRAQLSTKDLLVQSLREDRLAHEVKMQKLREALIAGDGEAAARIMGGDDQARVA